MRPGDEFLAKSIAAAFDRLPEPEAARLEGLERRLLLQTAPRTAKKVHARFWWLFAGLIATGAAAWWGGEYWGSGSLKPQPVASPMDAQDASNEERTPKLETVNDGEPRRKESGDSQNDSPTIYRREVY